MSSLGQQVLCSGGELALGKGQLRRDQDRRLEIVRLKQPSENGGRPGSSYG